MYYLPISIENLSIYLLREGSASLKFLENLLSTDEQQLLSVLRGLDGLEIDESTVRVSNRIKLALSAIERGIEPKSISKYLDWKEFEVEVARIFEEAGFIVQRNFRTNRPKRSETDVVALREDTIIAVDCKHWDPASSGKSRYNLASEAHFKRVVMMTKNDDFVSWVRRWINNKRVLIIPMLITLSTRAGGINQWGVVVPISNLSYVIQNLDVFAREVPHIVLEI